MACVLHACYEEMLTDPFCRVTISIGKCVVVTSVVPRGRTTRQSAEDPKGLVRNKALAPKPHLVAATPRDWAVRLPHALGSGRSPPWVSSTEGAASSTGRAGDF